MTKGDNASVILLPMGVERGQINKFVQKLEDNLLTDEKSCFTLFNRPLLQKIETLIVIGINTQIPTPRRKVNND